MDDIEIIKERIKNKRSANKNTNSAKVYVNNLVTRVLVSVIFILVSVIFIKTSDRNLLTYKEHVFNKSWSFTKVGNVYNKYLGEVLPFDKIVKDTTKTVFNESLVYKEKSTYHDGVKMILDDNYLVPVIESGIIVFKGEKEHYGQVVIVQGVDGYDIWYGNLVNTNLNIYDYIEKKTLLGEVSNNELYLVIQKDGKKQNYDEYIKN